MPGMDGYEVLKQLRADPKTKDLRVIFLSNLGQSGEVQDGLAAGAEDYIIKSSLTPSLLVQKVEAKLGVVPKAKIVKEKRRNVKNTMGEPSCVGLRVLMIEDNEAIISMYKLRLEKEGAIVTVAKNGAWGLRQAKSGEYDIILLDMIMPALHGLEAIQTLKKDPATAKIPVLVFSNSAQDQDIEVAKRAGAVNYLVKSDITPATLIWEIKKFCPVKK
jgi:twitching motility two-component system response regulator PilH